MKKAFTLALVFSMALTMVACFGRKNMETEPETTLRTETSDGILNPDMEMETQRETHRGQETEEDLETTHDRETNVDKGTDTHRETGIGQETHDDRETGMGRDGIE